MNEAGDQMLSKWFAFDAARDGYETEQAYDDVIGDDEAARPDLETGPSASPEADTHVHLELVAMDQLVGDPEAELDRGDDESDDVVAGASADDTQDGPVVEGDVTAPSYAVARLLEIATSGAEALVATAREEADHMVSQARAQSERIIEAGLADAQAREASMNAREEEQRVELECARSKALGELQARCAEVEDTMAQLLEFEGQVRTYLSSYFSGNLETLDRSPVVTLMTTAAAEGAQVS